MKKFNKIKKFRLTRGFNLIELLVSLVVVAVSLFAVAKIQITGMQGVEGAKQSTSSTIGVVNLIERLSIPEHRDGIRTLISTQSGNQFAVSGSLKKFNQDFGSVNCEDVPSYEEATNPEVAKRAINCEIGGWIESLKNAFNISSDEDICMNVLARDVSDSSSGFEYRNDSDGVHHFAYRIPRITVEYKWKKVSSAQFTGTTFCQLDNGLLVRPEISYSNDTKYTDTDIGFSSMEYILP